MAFSFSRQSRMNFSRLSFASSLARDFLHLQFFGLGQPRVGAGEDVEHGEFVLVQALLEMTLFLLVEGAGEGGQFLEQTLHVHAAGL